MKKNLLSLSLSQSMRSVAVSLLSLFSVIYIFRRIFELTNDTSRSLIGVFVFTLVLYLFKLVGTSAAENFALKYGLKKQIFLGHLLTGLALVLFALSQNNLLFLWLAEIAWGLAIGFFWFGRHGMMVKIGEVGKFGQATGTTNLIENVFLLGAPFLGGVIVSLWGYTALFALSLVFILLAFLALTPMEDQKTHQDVTLKEVIKLMIDRKRMAGAYFSIGLVDAIYAEGLTLYVFLNIKGELGFGEFFSLSMVVVAIISYIVCRLIDAKGKRLFVEWGSILSGLVWLGYFLSTGPKLLFLFDVVNRITMGMVGFPLEVLSFQKALDGHSTGRAILFRETAITLGSILAMLILIALVFLGIPLKYIFLITAPIALSRILIINKDGVRS